MSRRDNQGMLTGERDRKGSIFKHEDGALLTAAPTPHDCCMGCKLETFGNLKMEELGLTTLRNSGRPQIPAPTRAALWMSMSRLTQRRGLTYNFLCYLPPAPPHCPGFL